MTIKIVTITQEEYNLIEVPDESTLYTITGRMSTDTQKTER